MNNECLLCHNFIDYPFKLSWFFSFQPLVSKYLCNDCYQRFEHLRSPFCKRCGRQRCEKLCFDCHQWEQKGKIRLHNQALYCYQNNAMKDYFEKYKFMGDYHLRYVFQIEFQKFITSNYSLKKWTVVPIPTNHYTLNETRLFDQVKGLLGDLPYDDCLRMKEECRLKKQSHKTRKERMKTP